MILNNTGAEFFIPDNISIEEGLKRTTHMAIAAHQDDIEIMAYDGILKCFGKSDEWFCGVVVTNGAGSPRDDLYASYTDEEMQKVRKLEQKKAAFVGEYGALALLGHTSSAIKDPSGEELISEIMELVSAARPNVIYTHNLADKHDTHVGVAIKVIKALRKLPKELRPEKVYGCEVWRNLDWVNDDQKVVFDVSAHPNLAGALVEVFDSQICGGKRYDLAYGMDLTPLIENPEADIVEYIRGYIRSFENDVTGKLTKLK